MKPKKTENKISVFFGFNIIRKIAKKENHMTFENDFSYQTFDCLEKKIDKLPKSLGNLSDLLSRLEITLLRSQLEEEKEKVKSLERKLAGDSEEIKSHSDQNVENKFQYNNWMYLNSQQTSIVQ